jgi:hypothetical protein
MTIEEQFKLIDRAESAEYALREIALFLSCGGYNDIYVVEFDADAYVKKIKEAITEAQLSVINSDKKSLQ